MEDGVERLIPFSTSVAFCSADGRRKCATTRRGLPMHNSLPRNASTNTDTLVPDTNSDFTAQQHTSNGDGTKPHRVPQGSGLAEGAETHIHETQAEEDDNFHSLLPILFADQNYKLLRPTEHIDAFLRQDLSVERLTKIHGWLWIVGRPQAARSLHRQKMKNRAIIVTEQADLHLTWADSYIFIKPLPQYLLRKDVWRDHLCNDATLYENACGFLLSYAWLIQSHLDFEVAKSDDIKPSLLPQNLKWSQWQAFMGEFLTNVSPDPPLPRNHIGPFQVNKRYQYGELRLGRINLIYRFAPLWWYKYLFDGYHSGYDQYRTFFARNFAWLIVVFAYITVVLTAMQVGLALDGFKDDSRLTGASYGFSVFSLVLVAAAIGIAILLFIVIFVYNLTMTTIAQISRQLEARRSR